MTITSTSLTSLLVVGVVFALVYGGINLWRRRVPGLSGYDSVRASTYVARYATGLEYYGLRRGEIVEHTDALRADLAAAAQADGGLSLDRLGPPRTLAAGVASHLLRPSWLRGVIWAGVSLLAAMALSILLTEAFLGGFEPLAQPGQTGDWSGLGFSVEATMGDDGKTSALGFGSVWLLVAPLVAFLLGARAWRVLTSPGATHPADIS